LAKRVNQFFSLSTVAAALTRLNELSAAIEQAQTTPISPLQLIIDPHSIAYEQFTLSAPGATGCFLKTSLSKSPMAPASSCTLPGNAPSRPSSRPALGLATTTQENCTVRQRMPCIVSRKTHGSPPAPSAKPASPAGSHGLPYEILGTVPP